MIRFRKRSHEVPALNTASLPDLIFSVLFFFIIVTHMRQDEVKVKYRVPQGKELSDVARKSSVVRIYIGKPVKGEEGYCIQMDGKVVNMDELTDRLARRRSGMSPEDGEQITVTVSADKDTDMETVMQVKKALRAANALKVVFVGTRAK